MYICPKYDCNHCTPFLFAAMRVTIYTSKKNTANPVVLAVDGAVLVASSPSEYRITLTAPKQPFIAAAYFSTEIVLPITKKEAAAVFKLFAAVNNIVTLHKKTNTLRGVPVALFRACAWQTLLLYQHTSVPAMNAVWASCALTAADMYDGAKDDAENDMVNISAPPYSPDALCGITPLCGPRLISNASGTTTSRPLLLNTPEYTPYDGYANMYHIIQTRTHLPISAAAVASSLGSAVHLATDIYFQAPTAERRASRRRSAQNAAHVAQVETLRGLVSNAAPLAAETGHQIGTYVHAKLNLASCTYVGSDVPVLLQHFLRGGQFFAGFPDGLFKTSSGKYVSLELKTRWFYDTLNAFSAKDQASAVFVRNVNQALLQAVAVFMQYRKQTLSALLVAAIPKGVTHVKRVGTVLREESVTKSTVDATYQKLFAFLKSTESSAKLPTAFVDNCAHIPVRSALFDCISAQTEIIVCERLKRYTYRWTHYTPLAGGPGKFVNAESDAQNTTFLNFPRGAVLYGAFAVSMKAMPLGTKITWLCRNARAKKNFISKILQARESKFTRIVSISSVEVSAFFTEKGTMSLPPFAVSRNSKTILLLPDAVNSCKKIQWSPGKGANQDSAMWWLPELFRLEQDAAE